MVDVDNFVFMSFCLMFGGLWLHFLTKRHKDKRQMVGVEFMFLCLYV